MFTIYLCLKFLFYFSDSISFFPAQSNNIYHVLYGILFKIHRHQPFNQCFLFFSFVDNTLITVLMLQIILFVFVIIILILHGFQIFYWIILISTWRIIFISTWSICSFSIIIFCLVFQWFKSRMKWRYVWWKSLNFWSPKVFFLFFFLLVRSPSSQRLLIMVWC